MTSDYKEEIRSFNFKVCFCYRRIFKMKVAEPPEEIKKHFEKYSDNGTMSIDHLQSFLIEIQREQNATKDDAQAIFNSLKHLGIFQRKGLHFEAFLRYLLGEKNLISRALGWRHDMINAPGAHSQKVHQDMNAPLAHYFLYTGHNSYLTGNQVSSQSSVNPIKEALQRGVRVIELDLWPNSKKNDVDVLHGGTLTRPVKLIKCLSAIKEAAFIASEYPVVITFEDHLTPDLQAKVAQMVKQTFGPMLYCPEENLKEFPSPESLKKRILISTKPPKEYLEDQRTMERVDSQKRKNSASGEIRGNEKEDEDNATPEYKSLIAIHAGKLEDGSDTWFSDPNKVRRLSLSEQELENATKTRATDIVRFTQRNFLRIYPKGLRLDSSNYDPMLGWSHGAQMVAFNMQGYGKHLWIMQGMFRANGGCGYVKKPDFLLHSGPHNKVFDPSVRLSIKKTLKVKVYMGEGWHLEFSHTHFDRYSPPDFFTRVGIAGVPADRVMKETKVKEDQWLPVWDEEFEFPLTVPELAVLRIEVPEYDSSGKNDFGGQVSLPVSELKTGIRAVPLCNKKGDRFKHVRLLMKFEFV